MAETATAAAAAGTEHAAVAEIAWRGRMVRIEYAWMARQERAHLPLLVFLHEGLGSLSMWRDFPQWLCEAVNARGLVYSRPGYGQSTARAADESWGVDFMHRQAHEVLPTLLLKLGVDAQREPVILFGHSDGGSIALLAAADRQLRLRGVVAMAPHIMVEEVSVRSIQQAREAYQTTDLRSRLARHHADPDSAFWGWNDIWLNPAFRAWSIEADLSRVSCPVLAIQGMDDEYGSLEQIRGIARRVQGTKLLELPACGHSPHRDQPEAVIRAVREWLPHLAQ